MSSRSVVNARLPQEMAEWLDRRGQGNGDARGDRSEAVRTLIADLTQVEAQLGPIAPGELPRLAEHLRAIRNSERRRLVEVLDEQDLAVLRALLQGSHIDAVLAEGLELEVRDADADRFAPGQQANLCRVIGGLSYAARWVLIELVTRQRK